MIVIQIIVALIGCTLIIGTLFSAIRSFVLPRSEPDLLSGSVFSIIYKFFRLLIRFSDNYRVRDHIMAYLAPVYLLALLPSWLAIVSIGYSCLYWSIGKLNWYESFRISGSSLLTLGYAFADGAFDNFLQFSEATIGLLLVALLIAYLPTIYSAFSRRETAVTLLEVRAGDPPNPVEMLLRYQRIHGFENLSEQWKAWELWFADIDESHTSLSILVFFRSPVATHSWITACGTVLDAASLMLAAIDLPMDASAALCIRAGYLALRRIANYYKIPFIPDPHYPTDQVLLDKDLFNLALDQLEENELPIKSDRDQAWNDFAGWRVNYESVLVALSKLTLSPETPWIN
jgi:hypothetical protein